MFNNHKISETLTGAVENVEDTIISHYARETPPDEGSLNGYLALALADKLNESSKNIDTIEIYSEPYTKTEEKKTGADIGIRYQLYTPDVFVESGLIAQAKKDTNYDGELPLQCFKMLSRTGESYIFQYTESGINVYPARPVYYDGGWGGKFQKYYEISFTEFFTRFFEGFFGEPAIARSIDSPSDVGPRELYINHLIDVKIAAGDVSIDDEIFDYIGQNYTRLNLSDFPQFDL